MKWWLRQFWFFWWNAAVSYARGSIVRKHGAKILLIHSSGSLMRVHAAILGGDGERRFWFLDSSVKGVMDGTVAYLDDRGINWVYGWEGRDADALRATHLLVESA